MNKNAGLGNLGKRLLNKFKPKKVLTGAKLKAPSDFMRKVDPSRFNATGAADEVENLQHISNTLRNQDEAVRLQARGKTIGKPKVERDELADWVKQLLDAD